MLCIGKLFFRFILYFGKAFFLSYIGYAFKFPDVLLHNFPIAVVKGAVCRNVFHCNENVRIDFIAKVAFRNHDICVNGTVAYGGVAALIAYVLRGHHDAYHSPAVAHKGIADGVGGICGIYAYGVAYVEHGVKLGVLFHDALVRVLRKAPFKHNGLVYGFVGKLRRSIVGQSDNLCYKVCVAVVFYKNIL